MHLSVLGAITLPRLLESAPRLSRHFFDSAADERTKTKRQRNLQVRATA